MQIDPFRHNFDYFIVWSALCPFGGHMKGGGGNFKKYIWKQSAFMVYIEMFIYNGPVSVWNAYLWGVM